MNIVWAVLSAALVGILLVVIQRVADQTRHSRAVLLGVAALLGVASVVLLAMAL